MYWIQNMDGGRPTFYCDTTVDKDALPTTTTEGDKSLALHDADWKPCACGSHAFVCDSQDVFTLKSTDDWV